MHTTCDMYYSFTTCASHTTCIVDMYMYSTDGALYFFLDDSNLTCSTFNGDKNEKIKTLNVVSMHYFNHTIKNRQKFLYFIICVNVFTTCTVT